MSARPWYKWFPQDFLSKTRGLSYEEQGVYRAVLDELWINGPIEDTEQNLARTFGLDRRKVRRIFGRLRPYFDATSGRIDHTKIAKQRAEMVEKVDKARAAGRKGGQANAKATRARTRAGTDSDSDKDLNQTQDPLSVDPDRNGEPASLTAEQRRQAEVIDARLAERRRACGLPATGPPRAFAAVAQLRPDCEKEE